MNIEFQWLSQDATQKEVLQTLFQSSGQSLKKYYSSKELGRIVRTKDILRVPIDLVNHLKINPLYEGGEVRVLKETHDYLVLHKPSNVHCHPLRYSDTDTLLNYLASKNKWDSLNINSENYDRGLLYRLDYETSGIMVLAKTQTYFEAIRHSFQSATKRKIYLVIVEGNFNQEGSWTHYFKSSGSKGAKQKVSTEIMPDSHSGTLQVKKLSYQNDKSLLLVDLKTGLRHQIRAQLSFLGFPILGDELYGGAKAQRLFLHAWRYEWEEVLEDPGADLFDLFFDLNSIL